MASWLCEEDKKLVATRGGGILSARWMEAHTTFALRADHIPSPQPLPTPVKQYRVRAYFNLCSAVLTMIPALRTYLSMKTRRHAGAPTDYHTLTFCG